MVGYQVLITYNDDAMTSTLNLFNDIIHDNAPYPAGLVDDEVKDKLQASFDKGVECILATQIMVKGKPTVWCQQNDPVTLKPAGARAFELPAFCSAESVPIIKLLMELPNPDKRVKAAVHGAMKWLDASHPSASPNACGTNSGTIIASPRRKIRRSPATSTCSSPETVM